MKFKKCENCNKFSHCNNNNLVCVSEYDKLKQTLTDIKEIAKNGCYDDCGMPLDELSIILQKISECEGNDEIHSK